MQWNRAKTILIVVFLLVNAYLLVYYLHASQTSGIVSQEAINDIVSILSDNSISIDRNIIPTTEHDVRVFDATNKLSDHNSIASALLGEGYFLNDAQAYSNGSRTLTFDGDRFKLTDSQPIDIVPPASLQAWTEQSCMSYLDIILKDFSLNSNRMRIISFDFTPDLCTAAYALFFEDKQVIDSSLVVEFNKNGLVSMIGDNWLGDSISEGTFVPTVNITVPLINLANLKELDRTASLAITAISEGYYLGSREYETKTITALPAWIIKINTTTYIFDARNGSLIAF